VNKATIIVNGMSTALAEHSFEHLFIECLGWDSARTAITISLHGSNFYLTAVAQKRGISVFHCQAHRTVLANRSLLRAVQKQLCRTHHEHILIFSCETPRKQVWQWATIAADGRRIQHREHPFFSDNPPKRLLERLERLAVGIEEEESTTLIDVLTRVRFALAPDSEFNLFARRPWYAKESDRLAVALKSGEPGAFGRFVEFHMPLARKASRMLIRWFEMQPDDAEQTAMIGLLEAVRRFDPDRGYQFSTYASHWIRQCCQRYGIEWGTAIRIPDYLFRKCYKLLFVENELIVTYGLQEGRSRFQEELKNSEITAERWSQFCQTRRIDCFTDVEHSQRKQIHVIEPYESVDDEVCTDEFRRSVREALAVLKPRHARILELRYGFDGPERTLEEVGAMMGITRERVRQIQSKAEERLATHPQIRGFSTGFGIPNQNHSSASVDSSELCPMQICLEENT
jgi:RNA polymerase sigma factor (sigma-70 family)